MFAGNTAAGWYSGDESYYPNIQLRLDAPGMVLVRDVVRGALAGLGLPGIPVGTGGGTYGPLSGDWSDTRLPEVLVQPPEPQLPPEIYPEVTWPDPVAQETLPAQPWLQRVLDEIIEIPRSVIDSVLIPPAPTVYPSPGGGGQLPPTTRQQGDTDMPIGVTSDWGDIINAGIDIYERFNPPASPFNFVDPVGGGAAVPSTVTVNTRTGEVTKCKRRRRRRLLTSSDLSDLASLKAIVGGGAAMNAAVVKAVRR